MADSRKNGSKRPLEIARDAREQLAELIGRRPEGILGVERDGGDDGGWRVTLEVLELERVPNSTDLLGCYVARVDDQGELVEYQRMRRYQRGQPDEDFR
jgi:Gas vesicle synthesis protein GvpO